MSSHGREDVTLHRDCEAVLIPQGDRVLIREGANVTVTQALGSSFTVYLEGRLFRIDGRNADALGKTPSNAPRLDVTASREDVERAVWDELRTCYDPEIPINIVDLGLVYSCDLRNIPDGGYTVAIDMTLTAPGCGMGEVLVQDIKQKLSGFEAIKQVQVELVFDPPWSMEKMSEAAKLQVGLM